MMKGNENKTMGQGYSFFAGLVKKYTSPEFSVLKRLYLSCRCIGKGLHK